MSLLGIAERLQACQRLERAGALDFATALPMAAAASSAIMLAWRQKAEPPREAVTLLCALATASDTAVQQVGVETLFGQVVERLNDSFSHSACAFYDQLFAQVISGCRQLPAGAELDETLNRFGLYQEEDLLARKARLLRTPQAKLAGKVNKIVLLSRVTIGADVAINSVLLAALRARFPQAEFVWLGSPKLYELFGGDARVRVRELRYERGGGLLARLNAWLATVTAVAEEGRLCWQDDPQNEMLVIDADSRLTQLGLLPVVADDRHYYYFESRSYEQMSAASLAQLTAQWAREVFDTNAEAAPHLALLPVHEACGQAVRARFCRADGWLVAVSWGVGGNARKRLDAAFEAKLILNLLNGASWSVGDDPKNKLSLPACKLILDKGADEVERFQINQLLEQLRAQGKRVLELDEHNLDEMLARDRFAADVVTWDGGIGALAGLIAVSDAYVGYDSAGQHLAAALGTPTLTLFVNGNTPLFAARWRPSGSDQLAVINVSAESWERENIAAETLLRQAMSCLHDFGLQQEVKSEK